MSDSADQAARTDVAAGAIDVWAQITTERMLRRPWMQTLLRWTGSDDAESDGRGRRRHRPARRLARAGRCPYLKRRGGADGSRGADAVPRFGCRRSGTTDGGRARDPALG